MPGDTRRQMLQLRSSRCLTAGAVLTTLPEAPTIDDLLSATARILALPLRERRLLRADLARRTTPDDFVAFVRQVLEADQPDRPETATDLAAAVREVRAVASAQGWWPGRTLPRNLVPLARHLVLGLSDNERRDAPGILGGLFGVPADMFVLASPEVVDEINLAPEAEAIAAFHCVSVEVQALLASDVPADRWRGAVGAVKAGMPLPALITVLATAGERDPAGCAERASQVAGASVAPLKASAPQVGHVAGHGGLTLQP